MSERDPTEEIAELRAMLAAERAKGLAFAELSHDMRTLVSGVLGLASLLLDTELSTEQRDYVKRIRANCDSLVGLVNNVLDYGRIEAGKLELERADVDLVRIVEEIGDLMAERARARGIELVTSVAPEVPPAVRGDPTRLRQVLMNLVSNAIKFTERGEVCVRVSLAMDAGERALVRFEVRDTGVGISAEGRARLFQPYSQVHEGSGHGGSGLGLALSKHIVEAMGGSIGVESEPGVGSTFRFTALLERRGADTRAIPRVDMAGHRVLIAAANASVRSGLGEMLSPLGVEHVGVETGELAVASLRDSKPFDVVLLDVSVPGANELMRELEAEPRVASLPVVLLAYPGQRWEDRSETPGNTRTNLTPSPSSRLRRRVITSLAKPVRRAQLHACLTTLMGGAVETVTPDSRRTSAPESRRTRVEHSSRRSAIFAPAPEPSPAPPPVDTRPRILLVEDNMVNQRVSRVMMEKRGYRVDTANDGQEAVEAVGRGGYAAVLMDCQMPRLDGYMATREIRAREQGRSHLPIIAMTANAGPGARERCLEAGMDDYVSKPVTAEGLDEMLRRWLKQAGAAPAPTTESARTSEPPRKSSSPAIDLGMLRKLRSTQRDGEPDIVQEVIALFLEDSPVKLAAIREAAARGDLVAAGRAAHTLKGSAGHLGARTLVTLCARLEEKARAGAPFNVSFAVAAIEEELDRVRGALAVETVPKPRGEG